jgi:hypothetical protein
VCSYDYMEGLVGPEDLAQMASHLEGEALLHAHGFKPTPRDGSELWISYLLNGVPELWTRRQALDRIEDLQREEAS